MTTKENTREKYGLPQPKIAESNTLSLVHGLCGSGGSIYNKLALTMIDPVTGWFEIVKATNKSAIYTQDLLICFIIPSWHVTCDVNLLPLTVVVRKTSNLSSNTCVLNTIMALILNQLQVTTINPQANSIIEQVYKVISCP
jgi:hypothetical protein